MNKLTIDIHAVFGWIRLDHVVIACFALLLTVASPALVANTSASLPYKLQIQKPLIIQGSSFDYKHSIRVALPASYTIDGDRRYPVLWLTDGSLTFELAVGVLNALTLGKSVPEMIVVAVGAPEYAAYQDFVARRTMEFSPPVPSDLSDQVGTDVHESKPEIAALLALPNRADQFLTFLIDELRPELSSRYRMSEDHALFGHSFGGVFTSYALFARPGAFSKYLIGSPNLGSVQGAVLAKEREYAAAHKDLKASIFFGAGELELDSRAMAAGGVVGKMVELSDALTMREYKSLQLRTRIFTGKDHFSVITDLLTVGIQFLWRREIQAMKPVLQ